MLLLVVEQVTAVRKATRNQLEACLRISLRKLQSLIELSVIASYKVLLETVP